MTTLLSQLHLPRAATQLQLHFRSASAAKLQLPNATTCFPSPSFRRASLGFLIPSLRISNVVAAATRIPEDFQVQGDDDDDEVVRSRAEFNWGWIPGVVAAAGVMTTPAWPAHAVIKDEVEEMMRFSPEAWVNIYITTGIWLVLYFLLIPLGVYYYLRLRWYKRNFLETYFQFMLVFIFFPGMLLLAPFINFRRLPNDGAEEP